MGIFDYRIQIWIHSEFKSNDFRLSNVSRIHFGFKFIVNPDLDPIIE